MNFSFFGSSRWDIGRVTAPWGDRPSVYRHIVAHIRPGEPGLGEGGETLPDDAVVRGGAGFGWAPGALDGALGRHFGGGGAADAPREILDALRAITRKA